MNSTINFQVLNYSNPIVNLTFDNGDGFNSWLKSVASSHDIWVFNQRYTHQKNVSPIGRQLVTKVILETVKYRCNHYGICKEKKEEDQVAMNKKKKKERKTTVKKTGCGAMITCNFLNDNTASVVYNWAHSGHSPCDFEEIAKSSLPTEVKKWIIEKVEQNLDWKAIKSILRMDENSIHEV
jgi:hypothetical protein